VRFLLRNTVRDPKYAALRKMNEGKVVLRPFVGGKPLPPTATRILVLSDLTPALVAEIETLCAIGNAEFVVVGRNGPNVDFEALRAQLGWAPATEAPKPAISVTVPTPPVVVVAEPPPEPVLAVDVPAVAPAEEVVSSDDVPAEELVEEQEAVAAGKVWTREELEASKLTDLRDVLIALGGKPAGKNKATVVDEILAAQDGV
jgi:hypothetical protein